MGDSLSPEYIAGFLDGEGCFRFNRTLVIECATTYPETLETLCQQYGGRFRPMIKPGGKPMFRWSITGPSAMRVIEDIYPHMREKRVQASILRRVLRYPPKTAMRSAYLRELKALKRIPYTQWFARLKT